MQLFDLLIKTTFEKVNVFISACILYYYIISIVPRDQDHLSEFDNYCDTRFTVNMNISFLLISFSHNGCFDGLLVNNYDLYTVILLQNE